MIWQIQDHLLVTNKMNASFRQHNLFAIFSLEILVDIRKEYTVGYILSRTHITLSKPEIKIGSNKISNTHTPIYIYNLVYLYVCFMSKKKLKILCFQQYQKFFKQYFSSFNAFQFSNVIFKTKIQTFLDFFKANHEGNEKRQNHFQFYNYNY